MSRLETHLEEMIRYCQARGIKLLVLPAVPNLLVPPGSARENSSDPARFTKQLRKARKFVQQQRWDDAKGLFKELTDLDDNNSAVLYLRGLVQLGKRNAKQARQTLVSAMNGDRRGDRASGTIVATIMEKCQKHNVDWIDLRDQIWADLISDFRRVQQSKVPEHFNDHCHPSRKGHTVIGDAIVNYIAQSLDSIGSAP